MLVLNNLFPGYERIRNIIFDFGGVICDLDIKKTENKFKEFGPPMSSEPMTDEQQSGMWENLVGGLETAAISPAKFRQEIRNFYRSSPPDDAIDEAWNALLSEIPMHRIRLLEALKKNYRLFLLSNSNPIHYDYFLNEFKKNTGYLDFDGLFEKAYFSFNIHLRKPDPRTFHLVLNNHGLDPQETLFIDDTSEHIAAAGKVGIRGYHLQEGEDITNLFVKQKD